MRVKYIILFGLIGALLFSTTYVHARMFSNSSGFAFCEGDGTSSMGEAAPLCFYTIEELVIKGAEYYFKANADINLLSEKVEISDIYGTDYFTLWWGVNSALDNMNMARYYYQELLYKANYTPYNQVVINKLQTYDYESFQEKNGVIKDILSEVEGYLKNGDVRGIYSRTATYFDTIINTLETIKGELEVKKVPDNTHMWNLNQTCAKVHMFGQYVARIFENIR